ncbi:MAG: 4-(cytidine 5'-diphospho)-2-C-methyl-D-erythritol kinase, partial [Reyranella sp.]
MPLARAKVNLWLNVVGRRADGYHLLDSLVAFTDLADEVEVAAASDLSLAIDGPGARSLEAEADNLVLKAARLLAGRAGIAPRAAIRLVKRIPVAAGLGGGSADAAATLRALVELWRIAMPEEELFDLAAELGADVPMCLAGKPALVSGIGERLAPSPALPASAILLVNPGVPLPTPSVFA